MLTTTDTHSVLLAAICADPAADTPRLVYADVLADSDDASDRARAEVMDQEFVSDAELAQAEEEAVAGDSFIHQLLSRCVSEIRRLKHELRDPNYQYGGRIHRQAILSRNADIAQLREEIKQLKAGPSTSSTCPKCGKMLKSSWDFDASGKQCPAMLCVAFGGSCDYKLLQPKGG